MRGISERTSTHLGTETAFEVLAEVNKRLAKGQDITSFCIGQPDFRTPANICNAAKQAIDDGKHGYTASAGIPELRQAVASYFSKTRNIDCKPEHITIADGGKPFIGYTILTLTDPGKDDEVIYPNPGYPIYESLINAYGATPVPLPLLESKNFMFDIDHLKQIITPNTKLLILNSPQNPTGGTLDKAQLTAIADLAKKHDFWIYSDEVYSQHVYDEPFISIAELDGMYERTIVADCASKMFAMTGWRIGFAANPALAPHLTRWVTNNTSCSPHPFQIATATGLNGPWDEINAMVNKFKERRDLIHKLLNDIKGVKALKPKGAFYIFPNVTEACANLGFKTSEELRLHLLNHGVAVLSDIHFGQRNPGVDDQYIRLSYATSTDEIRKGLAKMKQALE